MGVEIAFKNGQISEFQRLVTLTLTLDRVILHTVMRHSSTSTYIPNFTEIEERFCGRTNGHFRHMLLCRLGGVDLTKIRSAVNIINNLLMVEQCRSATTSQTMTADGHTFSAVQRHSCRNLDWLKID